MKTKPVLEAADAECIVDGQNVGAIGVSGVESPEDAQVARAGIAALGESA